MDCMACGSAAVTERRERTSQGDCRFRCPDCGRQYNERSGGPLNHRHLRITSPQVDRLGTREWHLVGPYTGGRCRDDGGRYRGHMLVMSLLPD
jgi:tRNA(Ile2) C34 agmatinyltransferase TiaS